ncbi:amidase [Burkholderia vietnamiensis]|jgi:aspartyl-tRNA(Asn)/glutamyl-tRNA(Gln) amidotransferase subunit A|uniref:Amidase n=6 Tax=Bacteria TaxID=2 RepID=A0A0H3KTU4_BURM1|nr:MULTISPECIES: amidase [Burkholderia cepacia complex]ABO57305.1 Amidase [Burkholderia vietnamiensis G4]ABX18426.1 Amidase [Burkholderia multivorans ATCC 17616]AMU14291.1 amidase [Burkholderia cenocepacia]KVR80211.1 amidase [Burkholderia vietnamiensis]KVS04083.1 amidase [Burkholderia vietnamiensis]
MRSINTVIGQLRSGRLRYETLLQETLDKAATAKSAGDCSYVELFAAPKLLEEARAWQARADADRSLPALAGLPVSVKDLFDVEGSVTAAGSALLRSAPPANGDAAAVQRLREAGAIIVGRTNMSEFAYSGLGVNPHYGTPTNPVGAGRIAGGSSSGAAVAVARGLCAASLATDTGGSIRIPAALCGIAGFKPTAQAVSRDGVLPLSRSLDSVGPIASTAECCSIVHQVLTGGEPDTSTLRLDTLRLAVVTDYLLDELDPMVSRAFDRALALLTAAGASVETVAFPELNAIRAGGYNAKIVAAEAFAFHRSWLASHAHLYDPRVHTRLLAGKDLPAADYLDALDARAELINAARRRLAAFDAWLMPTVAIVAPKIGDLDDDNAFFRANAAMLRNPSVVNLLDGCALTLPIPSDNPLPQGLSVCGLGGADADVLAIGRSIEADWRRNSRGTDLCDPIVA